MPHKSNQNSEFTSGTNIKRNVLALLYNFQGHIHLCEEEVNKCIPVDAESIKQSIKPFYKKTIVPDKPCTYVLSGQELTDTVCMTVNPYNASSKDLSTIGEQ